MRAKSERTQVARSTLTSRPTKLDRFKRSSFLAGVNESFSGGRAELSAFAPARSSGAGYARSAPAARACRTRLERFGEDHGRLRVHRFKAVSKIDGRLILGGLFAPRRAATAARLPSASPRSRHIPPAKASSSARAYRVARRRNRERHENARGKRFDWRSAHCFG